MTAHNQNSVEDLLNQIASHRWLDESNYQSRLKATLMEHNATGSLARERMAAQAKRLLMAFLVTACVGSTVFAGATIVSKILKITAVGSAGNATITVREGQSASLTVTTDDDSHSLFVDENGNVTTEGFTDIIISEQDQ